jgi:hypothetical protein
LKFIRWASAAKPIPCGWFSIPRRAGRERLVILDLGNRFRLLVNEVEVVPAPEPLPKLPVARAIWAPQPNLEVAAAAWIHAGGAHHTGFSQAVTTEILEDFAQSPASRLPSSTRRRTRAISSNSSAVTKSITR